MTAWVLFCVLSVVVAYIITSILINYSFIRFHQFEKMNGYRTTKSYATGLNQIMNEIFDDKEFNIIQKTGMTLLFGPGYLFWIPILLILKL
jgi:hypothetical protein